MTDDNDTTTPACGARATLLVTLRPDGTATNVARQRLLLHCAMPLGHKGPHLDPDHAEQWDAPAGANPTLLRQEEDGKA
ncbi:MAG TPA: hypothetical protein VNG33_01175 [Polyangiaceae bacterium]|nr:hypothetical protein [Polyangiaceae bacterium]